MTSPSDHATPSLIEQVQLMLDPFQANQSIADATLFLRNLEHEDLLHPHTRIQIEDAIRILRVQADERLLKKLQRLWEFTTKAATLSERARATRLEAPQYHQQKEKFQAERVAKATNLAKLVHNATQLFPNRLAELKRQKAEIEAQLAIVEEETQNNLNALEQEKNSYQTLQQMINQVDDRIEDSLINEENIQNALDTALANIKHISKFI